MCELRGWVKGTVLENQDGAIMVIDGFDDEGVIGRRCNLYKDAWGDTTLLLLHGDEAIVDCLPSDLL